MDANKPLTSLLLFTLLGITLQHVVAQDFPDADHSLKLTGPDDEDMMTCAMPIPLPLGAQVEWYVNGKMLKQVYLPPNNIHEYESIQDLADLLGEYPTTVQCVINQGTINWVPVISNKLTLSDVCKQDLKDLAIKPDTRETVAEDRDA